MSGGGESLSAYVHPELADCAKAVSILLTSLSSFTSADKVVLWFRFVRLSVSLRVDYLKMLCMNCCEIFWNWYWGSYSVKEKLLHTVTVYFARTFIH